MSEVLEGLSNDFFCPITHSLMRDPVKAADGHVYDRLAITRWFAQRVTSPLTGETLSSTSLTPQKSLRQAIHAAAKARRTSEDGASYFACPFCGDESCASRSACRAKYEKQLRSDAAYGAAVRRRRWIEGNVLPSAERALRSGPVGAGALMVGAFSIGVVGAIVGGIASSITEVASGGVEVVRGIADAAATASRSAFATGGGDGSGSASWCVNRRQSDLPDTRSQTTPDETKAEETESDDENDPGDALRDAPEEDDARDAQRPTFARGCFKIASGAVLVPVASCSIAAMFAVGAACGSVALATGILREVGFSLVSAARATAYAIGGADDHRASDADQESPNPAAQLTVPEARSVAIAESL